jgi:hypothetical protein
MANRTKVVAGPDGSETVELSDEENAARDAEEAAWAAGTNDRGFAALREKRNSLLHDTDWWVLRGSVTEEQAAYRTTLRDLPANTDDPANPTWPVAPE